MAIDPSFKITSEIVMPLSMFLGGIHLGLIAEILLLRKPAKMKAKTMNYLYRPCAT
jgi:hypothetical protein